MPSLAPLRATSSRVSTTCFSFFCSHTEAHEIETIIRNRLTCLSGAQMGSNHEKYRLKISLKVSFNPIQFHFNYPQCVKRTSYMIYMFFKSSPDRKCICTFTAKRDFMLKTIFCSAIFLSFKFVFSFKIILLCKLFFSLQYLFSCPLYLTRFNLLNVW